jgi:integrase
MVARNVTHAIRPPKVADTEIASLTADQIADVLSRLNGHALHPIVTLALGTGMRRGEICALAWGAIDLDGAAVRVERSLEETKAGLRFKAPKTRRGYRVVSLPASVVEILRGHQRQQAEQRLLLGVGRAGTDDLVFARPDSSPYPPDTLSRDWWRATLALGLPRVRFHALRHSSASALIAAGLDVGAVSRRLGHADPSITLRVYTHQFTASDAEAAAAIERAINRGG